MNELSVSFFEQSPIAFSLIHVELDAQGVPRDFSLLRVNEAMVRMKGMSRETLIGKPNFELFPQMSMRWLSLLQDAAYKGKSMTFMDYSPLMERFLLYSFFPVEEEGCCGCVMEDMSPMTAQVRRTVDNVNSCLFYYDPETQTVCFPEETRQLYHLQAQYASMEQAFSEQNLTKRSAKLFEGMMGEYRAGGTRRSCEVQLRDGAWIKVSISRSKDGEMATFFPGYIENVTDQIIHQQIMEEAVNCVYEQVFRIDGRTGTFAVYNQAKDGELQPAHDGGFFDDAMREIVCRECYPEEAERVFKSKQLSNLKKQLEKKDSYEYTWRVKTTGAEGQIG